MLQHLLQQKSAAKAARFSGKNLLKQSFTAQHEEWDDVLLLRRSIAAKMNYIASQHKKWPGFHRAAHMNVRKS
jgi:hypothetical protein